MASRSFGYSWSFSAHQLNSIRTTFLDGISKWFLGEQVQPLSSMTSRRRLGFPLHSSAWFLSSQAELIGQRQDALGKWERLLGREGMKWIKSRRRRLTSAFQGVSINGGDGWVKQLCIKTIQNRSLRSLRSIKQHLNNVFIWGNEGIYPYPSHHFCCVTHRSPWWPWWPWHWDASHPGFSFRRTILGVTSVTLKGQLEDLWIG